MTDEKQTATADTDDQAKPDAEVKGAPDNTEPDEFEKALAEFDASTSKSEQQTKTETKDPTAERLERLERETAERAYRDDIGKAVVSVRGDLDPEQFDDEFVDTWLNTQARKDVRVANAWARRHAEPEKFARVLSGLKRVFAEKHGKFSKYDEDATTDRVSVANAVRGASGKAPEGKAPDLTKMSDGEVRDAVEKEYGYTPNF